MGEVLWPHSPEAEWLGLDGLWPNVRSWLPSMVGLL